MPQYTLADLDEVLAMQPSPVTTSGSFTKADLDEVLKQDFTKQPIEEKLKLFPSENFNTNIGSNDPIDMMSFAAPEERINVYNKFDNAGKEKVNNFLNEANDRQAKFNNPDSSYTKMVMDSIKRPEDIDYWKDQAASAPTEERKKAIQIGINHGAAQTLSDYQGAVKEQGEMKSQQMKDDVIIDDVEDRLPENAGLRMLETAITQAVGRLTGLAARPLDLVGANVSDTINKRVGYISEANRRKNLEKFTKDNAWILDSAASGVSSMIEMIPGFGLSNLAKAKGLTQLAKYAPALFGGVNASNQAITDGRESGLKGTELASYVFAQGGIETLMEVLPIMKGVGFESAAMREAAEKTIKGVSLSLLKDTGGEVGSEMMTTLLQAVADYAHNVDPEALTPENLASGLKSTLVSSLLMSGGMGAASGVQDLRAKKLSNWAKREMLSTPEGIQSWAEENKESVQKLLGEKYPVSRKAFGRAGLNIVTKVADRKAIVDELNKTDIPESGTSGIQAPGEAVTETVVPLPSEEIEVDLTNPDQAKKDEKKPLSLPTAQEFDLRRKLDSEGHQKTIKEIEEEFGVTGEQATKLAEREAKKIIREHPRDSLSGWELKNDEQGKQSFRHDYLNAARDIAKTGEDVILISMDMHNQGGTNESEGEKTDWVKADKHLKTALTFLREEIEKITTNGRWAKTGGDEFNAILQGITKEQAMEAYSKAQKRMYDYASKAITKSGKPLSEIPHKAKEKANDLTQRGSGVIVGVETITSDSSTQELNARADAALEVNKKKGVYGEYGNKTETTRVVAPEGQTGGTGQGVTEDTSTEAGEGTRNDNRRTAQPTNTHTDPYSRKQFQREITTTEGVQFAPKRFQFKRKTDTERGIQEGHQLKGPVDVIALGQMVFYEEDGTRYVVSGHHRLDLLRRRGKDIDDQQAVILKKSEGWTEDDAKAFGARLNIKEGGGEIDDYAAFIRFADISKAKAEENSLLGSDKARKGFAIGKYAGEDLYALYLDGKITDNKAAIIANGAPNNAEVQAEAIKQQKTMKLDELETWLNNIMLIHRAAKAVDGSKQGSLFGDADSQDTIRTARKLTKLQLKKVRDATDRLNGLKGLLRAGSKLTEAEKKAFGVGGMDEAGIKEQIDVQADIVFNWKNAHTSKELMAQLYKELGLESGPLADSLFEKAEPVEEKADEPSKDQGSLFSIPAPKGSKKAPTVNKAVDKIKNAAKDDNIDLQITERGENEIHIQKIIVPEDARGEGMGSKHMDNIVKHADENGKTITLSPSRDFGATSVSRLKQFYKSFGFVENKGKNKDFEISESMYRIPEKPKPTKKAPTVNKAVDKTPKKGKGDVNRGNIDISGTLPENSRADWSSSKAETKGGGKLLARIKGDNEGVIFKNKKVVGVRSIVDYVNKLVGAKMMVSGSQVSKSHPAHLERKRNLIRTVTGASQINLHEAGHGLSVVFDDQNNSWINDNRKNLLKLTGPGTMASANSAEEGFAEFIRKYIADHKALPSKLVESFDQMMQSQNSEILAGLRDAHRAYTFHRSRPIEEQMATLTGDKGKAKTFVKDAKETLWAALYAAVGGDVIMHRLRRHTWSRITNSEAKDSLGSMRKLAREFFDSTKDTKADFDTAYQTILHIPQEVQRLLYGAEKGQEGIRVRSTGDNPFTTLLSEKDIAKLKDAGFVIPEDEVKHGNWIHLNDQSFNSIKEAVGEKDWGLFEQYGQYRAALDRFSTKGHSYPGMTEGLTPQKLEEWLGEINTENPTWDKHFKDIQNHMDQLLLVTVLSGEINVERATSIKETWHDYWPLPRLVEDRSGKSSGAGADPTAGIKGAWGSLLPFKGIDEAVEVRTRMALESYYQNRLMNSIVEFGDKLSEDKDMPLDAKTYGSRLMSPLKLDIKPAATMNETEVQEIIADYLNEQDLKEGEMLLNPHKPENIQVSTPLKKIWRGARPNTVHVVRVFRDGKPMYYQVMDPMLFDLFSGSKNPSKYLLSVTKIAREIINPWKRAITQSLAFAVNNLPRDADTAITMSHDIKGLVPFYYAGASLVNRMIGDTKSLDAKSQSELLSRALEHTNTKAHRTIVENFTDMLKEGIVSPGYSDMNFNQKLLSLPGQIMSTVMKPLDMFNWVTGGRYLSAFSESLAREGAYTNEINKGKSDEQAQTAFDQITGNFGQRGGNATVAEVVRVAGFLNPALQIMWGYGKQIASPDPKVRNYFLGVKLPALTVSGAIGGTLNYLLIHAIWGDDEDELEERLETLRERQDEDRLRYMAVGGKLHLPFNYGLSGAAVSYGWNTAEEYLLKDDINGKKKAKMILSRALDLPTPTDIMHPHIKTALELYTNHSFFFDNAIEPTWMNSAFPYNPELRAYASTPEIYKQLGEGLKVSPIKIQYAVKQIFTRATDDLIILGEKIANKEPIRVNDIPIAKRLLLRDPTGWKSDSVSRVKDMDERYESAKKTLKTLPLKHPKRKEIAQSIRELSRWHRLMLYTKKAYKAIKNERKKKNPDYDKIKMLEAEMVRRAKKGMNIRKQK